MSKTTLLLTSLALTATIGCDKNDGPADTGSKTGDETVAKNSDEGESTKTAAASVDVTFTLPLAEKKEYAIKGTQAFVYPNKKEIVLVESGVKADCGDRPWAFGGDIGKHAAFVLRLNAETTTTGEVSTGYTVYYPNKGKTTNSGNSSSAIKLTFSKVDDTVWSGELDGEITRGGPIKGKFTAKVCK